ncbi:hypothetical protein OG474_30740 [Kribbella sp. NBC_01505]|uniref:hypothetical protein n=1 Tax=Kribbella sp. NBC_01505 TaxID=2903580 RepID=UPI003863B5EF
MDPQVVVDEGATLDTVKDSTYSFLSWLRTGIATKIDSPESRAASTTGRATVPVRLRLSGEPVTGPDEIEDFVEQPIQIYGPGDVVGVDPRAIVRTEPRPWITNVEPNYLAHIEFYDEDFLWRYSPAPRDNDTNRLHPWLALIVLAAPKDPQAVTEPGPVTGAEFKEGVLPDRPLPFIDVLEPAALPPHDQLGAWAHVHVNGSLAALARSTDDAAGLAAFRKVLADNPDNASCRLICPRHLLPNTTYHAFLVPAFETGRLSGLGITFDPDKARPTYSWGEPGEREQAGRLPYYHRWFFSTGSTGDFEALVRLLKPQEVDKRVGRREIDVHNKTPPMLPGITDPVDGVLLLGGALRAPSQPLNDKYELWDRLPPATYPHVFQEALAKYINLADDYAHTGPAVANAAVGVAQDTDPVITPPLYGRWHALTNRLLNNRDGSPVQNRDNWVHKLNLDPRFRVAANFGTNVIQAQQEDLMAAAWKQVGDIVEANAKIRAAQVQLEVGTALNDKHITPKPKKTSRSAAAQATVQAVRSGRILALTAPANTRVTTTGPPTAKLDGADPVLGERLAVGFRVAESVVAAAPLSPTMRRITRPGARLIKSLTFPPATPPETLVPRMDSDDPASPTAAAPKVTPPAVVTPQKLDAHLPPLPGTSGDPVNDLPFSITFRITLPEENQTFDATPGQDSDEARIFKDALRTLHGGWNDAAIGGYVKPREILGADAVGTGVVAELSPKLTVPKNLQSRVTLPPRLSQATGQLAEVMAYPVFDTPMYQALLDQGDELFVPNINLVPPNSVTLMNVNQPFIEAYMTGLNHEMARELLWREYPTDQRGTPFRQFWDVKSMLPLDDESAEDRRKRLYDVEPLHLWKPESKLGEHDNRDRDTVQGTEVVLVIRGELLRKYPNAVVYAHKAVTFREKDGTPVPAHERDLCTFRDPADPAPNEVQMPIYEALVQPDIYLLGFDLTEDQVRGVKGADDPDGAGWFFVIKERPGDPRFGVDDGPADVEVEVWNDLTWKVLDPGDSGFLRLDEHTPTISLDPLELGPDGKSGPDQEKVVQRLEDDLLETWNQKLGSADIAYMLFQAPVLMAVHAQEMLPKKSPVRPT